MEGMKDWSGTAVAGLNSNATRTVRGAICFNSSTHFPPSRLLKNAVWRRIFAMCAAATTGKMGVVIRAGCGNRYDIASYLILQTDSSRCGQKLRDANEIVSGCRQHEKPFHQRPPAMSGLAQPAHRLNPTEGLFDLFSFDRADAMTGVASSPRVDCRATVGIVLRHMRCTAALATAGDEIRRVV